RLADLPRGKPIFQRGEGGIVAALEADQAGDAGFCDTSRTVASARERQIHRFFAEDRLLRRRRALDELGVRIGGRADDHSLDARVAEDLLGAADLRAVFLRELGRSCRVTSTTYLSLTPGWRTRLPAWILPMRPAPKSATSVMRSPGLLLLQHPLVHRIVLEMPFPRRSRHHVEIIRIVAVGHDDRVIAAR